MASNFGKVAICISGLVRTGVQAHPCFNNFFKRLDADVFYHTWTAEPQVLSEIEKLYSPIKFKVDELRSKEAEGSFGSMLFSMMAANDLKKDYEIENDFRYDLVIRTRFDLVFPEHRVFPDMSIDPRTIYSSGGSNGYVHTDYESHAINDIIYWGDSEAMDIVSDTYMHYRYNALRAKTFLDNKQHFDPGNYFYSVGNMIYDLGTKRNIAFVKFVQGINEIPWRADVSHLNPLTDYNLIKQRYEQN
jgi:hypothetical protein